MTSSVFGVVRNKVFSTVFKSPFNNPFGELPWYQQGWAAIAVNGTTVYPCWIADFVNNRYAKSTSPNGSVSQVTFSGLLENFTRASDATYFDASGTLQTATTNVPRFTYDPSTLQPLGLLIEESKTNILLNSGVSGTLPTQSVTTSATTYTLSFYGTGTVTLSGTSTDGPIVGTGNNTRVSLTFTPTAGTLTLTVSGTVKWANLELGSNATSFIPTGGSAVTRAQDIAQTTDLSWYNATDRVGTFIVEVKAPDNASSFRRILQIDDNSSNNYIAVQRNSMDLRFTVVTGGTTLANTLNSGFVNNSIAKIGVTFGDNNVRAVLNSGGVQSDTVVTIPSGLVRFNVGHGSGGYFSSPIQKITYYAKQLTVSELQRLTA